MRWFLLITLLLLALLVYLLTPFISAGMNMQEQPTVSLRADGGSAKAGVRRLLQRYPAEKLKSGEISDVSLTVKELENVLRTAAIFASKQSRIGSEVTLLGEKVLVKMSVPMQGEFVNLRAEMSADEEGQLRTDFLQVGDDEWPTWMADMFLQQGLQKASGRSGMQLDRARVEGKKLHFAVSPLDK
ncbi:MAG: hypothetical protein Q9N68_05210 [Gammaproteobacteria bacterium]|nr:hypothetical protein [Gammaproteobacteria bacterium]